MPQFVTSSSPRHRAARARWSRRRGALLPVVFALGIGLLASPVLTTSSSAATPVPTLGLIALENEQVQSMGDTSRYAYVVLQEPSFGVISKIKRANPRTKVLSYMESAFSLSRTCGTAASPPHGRHDTFGVDYCWAKRNAPAMFLKDHNGRAIEATDYTNYMAMDIGSQSYAQVWARGVSQSLSADGFDGVWMDDVNMMPGHGIEGRFAKYTDVQYGNAMTLFAKRAGDYLRSHGLMAWANVAANPWEPHHVTNVLQMGGHLTGVNREHFSRYGHDCGPFTEPFNTTGNHGTPPLGVMMDYERRVQGAGMRIAGIDYGHASPDASDYTDMVYGRSEFFLTWNGAANSAYFFRSCRASNPAQAEWTTELGAPTGAGRTLGNGVMTRTFQRGVVFLNPSRDTAATVQVPVGMTTVRQAAVQRGPRPLPAETALILLG